MSNYSSSQVMIFPALETNRLEVIPMAMAREILVDEERKPNAVSYVDESRRREMQVRAKAVVLAASACESARLLLNSTSEKYPNGLANSSDAVGRYLTDSVGSSRSGYLPQNGKDPAPQPRWRRGIAHVHPLVEVESEE